MFKIVFTKKGEVVTEWKHYATTAEARRAIADCDLIIPFDWEWTIEEV